MDISKLMEPAERLFEFGKDEYVKLRLFPLKARYQIEQAKMEGIDVVKLAELVQKNKLDTANENKLTSVIAKNEAFKGVLTPDFNGGIDYQILVCLFGVDPDDHSFVWNGKNAHLDRAFWENLLAKDPKTFAMIQKAAEMFQEEYRLLDKPVGEAGEQKGNS